MLSPPSAPHLKTFWSHLFSDDEVREMDVTMIKNGMPSETLMEIAGHQCAVAIQQHCDDTSTFIILCGGGNNGGDGYVVGRWLSIWGFDVTLCAVVEPKTTDAIKNVQRCECLGISNISWTEIDDFIDTQKNLVLIESILGTGQNRMIEGLFGDICDWLHHQKQRSLLFSIDTPLGIGRGQTWHEKPVDPHFCLNIGASKWSLYTGHITGQIINIDIGFSQLQSQSSIRQIENSILDVYPKLSSNSVKWDKGHVAILAKKGAAVLAAHSALACGAGLVTLLVDEEDLSYLIGLRPEIILAKTSQLDPKRHDALIVGPAFGFEDRKLLKDLWNNFPKPALFDADALRIIDKTPSPFPRVITPHSAEAGSLLGISRVEIEQRPFVALEQLSAIATCVLKGHHSKISDGKTTLINTLSAPLLGTAGSGDVLCGVIGTLLSKGLDNISATALGVFLHAEAGSKMKYGDGASRIIDLLQDILNDHL